VLYVASDLGPGGSELQMLALARRLPSDRFVPTFILLRERGIHADAAEAEGIRVHLLGIEPARVHGWPRFAWSALRGVLSFVFIARSGRFDIAEAWLFRAYWLVAITRWATRVRVVIAGRRSLSEFKTRWSAPARLIDRLARSGSDVIVANSEAVRRDVIERERIAPDQVLVIHNGVTVRPEPTPARRAEARARWGFKASDFVIGCVANLKPRKGIETLVRAFALRAQEQDSRLRLVLIGDGPLRSHLKRIVEEVGLASAVVFHGTEPEPWRMLAGMDLFVHPSESEGMPNAVLEAAAAGLPIVATPAGGTVEIVLDGVTGLLTPPGDESAMAAAIGQLVDDPELRGRLGAAARARAESAFGMERFVSETISLYERLTADRDDGYRMNRTDADA
jgi:glycosyltransferase involved in cell wall biosynthesis